MSGVGGFDGKVVMAMPAATSLPQTQRVVCVGIPSEFQPVSLDAVLDRCPSFANRMGESLATFILRTRRGDSIDPNLPIEQ